MAGLLAQRKLPDWGKRYLVCTIGHVCWTVDCVGIVCCTPRLVLLTVCVAPQQVFQLVENIISCLVLLQVLVCDYVKPTPLGTTWGLGGTCVNVGCIPKKLYHTSAILGETIRTDLEAFGWLLPEGTHNFDWGTLRKNIQTYVYNGVKHCVVVALWPLGRCE